MYALLLLFLAVQLWTPPFRVSPDTLADTHPAICIDDVGDVWVCWYNSYQLWTRRYSHGSWSEVYLIDTAKCLIPEVTTSNMCKGTYEIPAWIVAWTDSSGYIRLSLCNMEPIAPSWTTTPPDSRIMGYNPAVVYDPPSGALCTWTVRDTLSIYYLISRCDGVKWETPDTIAEYSNIRITFTTGITTDTNGNVWVSWNDDMGTIWAQCRDEAFPESIGSCYDYAYSTISADSSGNVWVAWLNSQDEPMKRKILTRYYDGIEWSDTIEFPHFRDHTSLGLHMPHQDICSDNRGRLWAGWREDMGIDCPNYVISAGSYYGGSWVDSAIIDSYIWARGGYPSIACGDSEVWIVWQSSKEGDWNIYAIRGYFRI